MDSQVARVLEVGTFIRGPAVDEFEKRFADYIGVRHAVGVSSGLDALRLALTALNVGPGDEGLVPANTFVATALAVSPLGRPPPPLDPRRPPPHPLPPPPHPPTTPPTPPLT